MEERVKVIIQDGKIKLLYKDDIAHALQKGLHAQAEVSRISHVEPLPGERDEIEFQADLSPIGGPVLQGFPTYKAAVTAEVKWAEENHFTLKKKPECLV